MLENFTGREIRDETEMKSKHGLNISNTNDFFNFNKGTDCLNFMGFKFQ